MEKPINTLNALGVGITGDEKIVITLNRRMTADEAINCAAYLVLMAECVGDLTGRRPIHTFDQVREAIKA